jgi:hypothetical protein
MDGGTHKPEETPEELENQSEVPTATQNTAVPSAASPAPEASDQKPPEPTVVREVEKRTIVKEVSQKAPKTVEKIVERVVEVPAPTPVVSPEPKSHKGLIVFLILIIVLLLAAGGFGYWYYAIHKAKPASVVTQSNSTVPTKNTTASKAQGLQLDPNKNYGNKYASGLLPVGDGKYVTSAPKTGYVYACSQYAQNLTTSQGGASTRGPWFVNNNTEYDVSKKLHVQGSVMWQANFTNTISGTTRTIVTNDLPSQPTGIFPIMSTDPAYQYDHNPNTIKGQTLTYSLSTDPTYNVTPNCMGGESGIMLTGIALFNAFDAGGRDAGAWEVQDSCDGHPQSDGIYHYHTLSSCIKDVSVHTVIGFALDGFPITGPDVGTNNVLTTSDLDECHGLTSQIYLDGKSVTMYHYVMTQDFPYSVSCFRGTPITPPDLALGATGQQGPPPQKQ